MNTRSDDVLPYRELSRQEARISRSFRLAQMPRLAALASGDPEHGDSVDRIHLQLALGLTAEGQPRLVGELQASIWLDCHGCAETRQYALEIAIDCLIADSDSSADELARADDVVLATDQQLDLLELAQDEILLNLPERLCTETPCRYAPALAYPAVGEEAGRPETGAAREDNPFAVLADLKKR